MSIAEFFHRFTRALDKAGILYMLTGSFASAYYGTPRSTQDIDLVMEGDAERLRAFVHSLPADQYYVDSDAALAALKHQSQFNVIDLATGWKVDLMIRKSRPFSRKEFGRRLLVTLEGVPIYMVSAEDLVISKLEWSRLALSQRQMNDVVAILRIQWDKLDHAYLDSWISELSLAKEWAEATRMAAWPG